MGFYDDFLSKTVAALRRDGAEYSLGSALHRDKGPRGERSLVLKGDDNCLDINFGFDLFDSNTVSTWFGRFWQSNDGWGSFSAPLFVFAEFYEMEFPQYHRLGFKEEIESSLTDLMNDVCRTVPTLNRRVTLSDIEKIEEEQFGAAWAARQMFGNDYKKRVTVANLKERS